jgi:hypothetical protein
MKHLTFKPDGCPFAGFYADLGHKIISPLVNFLNENYLLYKNDFEVHIDGTNVWKNFKTDIDTKNLYDELFKQDFDKKITLPYNGICADNWTILKNEDFTNMNSLLQKYFQLSDKQALLFDHILKKYSQDFNKTIGVHYRGTDKHKEVLLAPPTSYINLCENILITDPELSIMIQTDQKQVRDLFKQHFKSKCWFIEELPVTEDNVGLHFNYSDKIALAKYMEIAVRLLARCKHLIVGTSNVATFIGAHRNCSKNIYQFNTKAELIK